VRLVVCIFAGAQPLDNIPVIGHTFRMPLLFKFFYRIGTSLLICAFLSTSVYLPQTRAGEIVLPVMPAPGTMVQLSSTFTPAHLQGITIHPDNALQFDFLIHKGDGNLTEGQKSQEYTKLIKYFLASLTVPDKDQWVNLSPYEKGRIIEGNFGKTEMGRDLLEQDYLLKQITSSLMYPEKGLGKAFWDKVYAQAWMQYHTTNIPVNTFNKVWIVPDEAVVYESGNTAYIIKSHLKVMLEEDYLSLSHHVIPASSAVIPASSAVIPASSTVIPAKAGIQNKNNVHALASQIIRQIILPQLEREVNEGKNFSQLRQIVSGMILATWYKKALKGSLLGKIYADKAKIQGINVLPDSSTVMPVSSNVIPAYSNVIPAKAGIQYMDVNVIYQQYLAAFKKGVYNYIKEDADKYTQQTIPRKYFAGGFEHPAVITINKAMITPDLAMAAEHSLADAAQTIDSAMVDLQTPRNRADAAMKTKFEGDPEYQFRERSSLISYFLPANLINSIWRIGGQINIVLESPLGIEKEQNFKETYEAEFQGDVVSFSSKKINIKFDTAMVGGPWDPWNRAGKSVGAFQPAKNGASTTMTLPLEDADEIIRQLRVNNKRVDTILSNHAGGKEAALRLIRQYLMDIHGEDVGLLTDKEILIGSLKGYVPILAIKDWVIENGALLSGAQYIADQLEKRKKAEFEKYQELSPGFDGLHLKIGDTYSFNWQLTDNIFSTPVKF